MATVSETAVDHVDADAVETPRPSWAGRFRVWITPEFDARGLAFFRVGYAAIVIGYLISRASGHGLTDMHSDLGVMPGHGALFRMQGPYMWSLLAGLRHPLHVGLFFTVLGGAAFSLLVGFRTRLSIVVVVLGLISMHYRTMHSVNASMQIMHLIGIWAALLPLGDRFSVDAYLRARRGEPDRPNRVVSIAALGARINVAVIYIFNVANKTGETWSDGSAVHYMLWQDRVATDFSAWLRMREPSWFSPVASYGTLLTECTIAALILFPVFGQRCRRLAAVVMFGFHFGIDIFAELGPFPWSLTAAALLMLALSEGASIDALARRIVRRFPRTEPFLFPVRDTDARPLNWPSWLPRAWWGVRELAYAALLCCVLVAIRHDNPILNQRFGRIEMPRPVLAVIESLYIPQGWAMFSPDVPRDDMYLVADVEMLDGRHVDPFTGEPPDLEAWTHGPWHLDYYWHSLHAVHGTVPDDHAWSLMIDYIARLPEMREWEGERRVRSVKIYRLRGIRPAHGHTTGDPPIVELIAQRGPMPITLPQPGTGEPRSNPETSPE